MSVEEVGTFGYPASNVITWIIPSFSLFSRKIDTRIWSPSFVHCGDDGNSGRVSRVHPGFLQLNCLSKDGNVTPVHCVRFGLADMKNSEICCCDGEWRKFSVFSGFFKVSKFVSIEVLNRKVKENPRFRLFCEPVKQHCQVVNASIKIDSACVTVAAENVVEDEEQDYIFDKRTADEVNSQDLKSLRKLGQNLKELYVSGNHSDVLIKVKDREFKVHKAILTARSSVFNGMFSHDLSESNSGIVPIEDCEPAVFEEFLFYVYTGKTQHLSSDNACELYYVADKYDIPEMKEECISFLKKSLSIESICDVICLSTKCNISELLDLAITFFARNMEEILVTVKWFLFMKENPVEANELSIKALKLGFTKRKI